MRASLGLWRDGAGSSAGAGGASSTRASMIARRATAIPRPSTMNALIGCRAAIQGMSPRPAAADGSSVCTKVMTSSTAHITIVWRPARAGHDRISGTIGASDSV